MKYFVLIIMSFILAAIVVAASHVTLIQSNSLFTEPYEGFLKETL